MAFSKKFDFLLKLTSTSNSVIAHRLRLDPSYISKLRHGSRSLPRDSEHAPKICAFIVNQAKSEFQRKSLCETLKAAPSASEKELEKKLLSWLYDDDEGSSVHALLSDFSVSTAVPQKRTEYTLRQDMLAFYGDEGRRQASIALLNLALAKMKPVTVLFYSDEDAAWMSQSSTFFYEWSSMIWQIILHGGKIKVIHKVSNDIEEMFDVIRRWLPFYASGAVEAFYYPRLRDGIYKRSLCVVPGVAAHFSTSIGQNADVATTFLVQDQQSVDSFTNEFYSYAALCKPLVEFYSISSNRFLSVFEDFLDRGYESIVRSDSLSLTTLPKRVLRNLETRIRPENVAKLRRIHEGWNNALLGNPGTNPINHILRLADPTDVLAGKVPVSCVGMLEGEPVYYRPDEYCAHLEYLLWLMDTFPWFNVILNPSDSCGYTLHVFEEQQVYIFKEVAPYIIFRIGEPNMVRAFWEYMHRMQDENFSSREAVKKEIRDCLNKLKNR